MKYLTHIPVILCFLALVFSGCDSKNSTSQDKKEHLNPRGRENFATDTPQKQVNEIVQPARPELSGVKNSSTTSPKEIKTAQTLKKKASEDPTSGESVYMTSCSLCHGKGVAGAPLFGVQQEWSSRISKSREKLVENAINGFQGSKGFMPAKGGNPTLSDANVEAAVTYMLDALNHK
jgi:cytochrome c5